MSIGTSIITGLIEAVEYEKGNLKNVKRKIISIAPLPDFKNNEIKILRANLNLPQRAFANLLGVSIKTVEAWEAGRNTPSGPAQRVMELFRDDSLLAEKYISSK